MKRKSPVFIPLTLVVTLLLLTTAGCKKSKNTDDDNSTEIVDVRSSGSLKTVALNFSPGSETIAAITLKNISEADEDVHVRLTLDNAGVNAAKLMPLPSNAYTLSTLEYDVPANGSIPVFMTINRSNLTVDTTYGIGFTIAEVSDGIISAEAKNIIVKITLRNRWDGIYAVTGTMVDATSTVWSHADQEVKLVTTSPTQVKMIPVQLGIEGIIIKNLNNLSFYASFGPVFTFNNANAITSVVNFYGQPSPNGRSAELDVSATNAWNPSSKSMNVKYWMNEPAAISGHRSTFTNTLTFVKER